MDATADDAILLLLADGGVRMFSAARPGDGRPLLASDVLAEFPGHRLRRLDSQSPSCLSARAALRPGTTYFLVEPTNDLFSGFDPALSIMVDSSVMKASFPQSGPLAGSFPDFGEADAAGDGCAVYHSRNANVSSSGSISSSAGSNGSCGSGMSSSCRRLIRGFTSPAAPARSAAAGTQHSESQRGRPPTATPDVSPPPSLTAAASAVDCCGNVSPNSPVFSRAASWSTSSASAWSDACGTALSYGTAAQSPSPRSILDSQLESPHMPRSRHQSPEAAAFEFINQHNATTSSVSRRNQRAPVSPAAPLPPRCSAQQQPHREYQEVAMQSGRVGMQRSNARNKIVSLEDIVYGRASS